MKITKEQIVSFWKYMEKRYKFRTVQKATAREMQMIAWALDLMGIQNKKQFMENYTTTIGNVVYVPFEIGEGNLISQAMTCAHEAQHVVQFRQNRELMLSYLYDRSSRLRYELEAYSINQQLHHSWTGRTLPVDVIVGSLSGYGLRGSDLGVARVALKVSGKIVSSGNSVNSIARSAEKWFSENV